MVAIDVIIVYEKMPSVDFVKRGLIQKQKHLNDLVKEIKTVSIDSALMGRTSRL